MSPGWMSPGLARYLAFSGKASRALSVSLCAAAIALRRVARLDGDRGDRRPQDRVRPGDDALDPCLPGGRRPGVAAPAHAVDVGVDDDGAAVDRDARRLVRRGDELGDRLELGVGVRARVRRPSTRSTRAPTRSCSRPRRPRRRSSGAWCWDARRRPGSRPRTSPGSIARTIVPSRSMYAVADGPVEPARLA